MKFVSYNIQYSKGKDGEFELERIADELRGADVIALQEVVRNVPKVPHTDHPAGLSELLPEHYWVYGPSVDLDASNVEDGRVVNRRLQFGNMLLSRYKILSSRLLLLPRVRTYDVTSAQRAALEGLIDLPSGPLRVYSVHLDHINHRQRLAQIEHLLPLLFSVLRDGASVTGPGWNGMASPDVSDDFVLMGDFNMTPGSIEYEAVVGEPDYYQGSSVAGDRLVDTWTRAGHPVSEGVTWYDETDDWNPAGKLDYGFVTAGLADSVTGSWIVDAAAGSDHNPLWFELDL